MEARKSRVADLALHRSVVPAMEPGHGGQEERRVRVVARGRRVPRNGAWPWRPGRGTRWSTSRRCVTVPQWSLAMEARKSAPGAHSRRQWSRPRNGAWPWRPGRESWCDRAAARGVRPQWSLAMEARKRRRGSTRRRRSGPRNGAWPWRPGRGRETECSPGRRCTPAMEPGHGGQEETLTGANVRKTHCPPAMEPGHGGQEEGRIRGSPRW